MTLPTIDARLARDPLELKAEALMRGLLEASEGDIHEALRRLAMAMAWLTSPNAENRAKAKKRLREWIKDGSFSQAKP